jgi:hypothetical protein
MNLFPPQPIIITVGAGPSGIPSTLNQNHVVPRGSSHSQEAGDIIPRQDPSYYLWIFHFRLYT